MIERESRNENILKEVAAEKLQWFSNEFIQKVLKPQTVDYKLYEAEPLQIKDKTINIYVYGKNIQLNQFDNIIEKQYVQSLTEVLDMVDKKFPYKLDYLNNIVFSMFQQINENTNEPANAVNLKNYDYEYFNKPLESTEKTNILFPNILNLGSFRDEIEGVKHLQGVMMHEQGHLLPMPGRNYIDIFNQEGGITKYGSSHFTEDYCDAVSLYYLNPEKLKSISSEKYKIVDENIKKLI